MTHEALLNDLSVFADIGTSPPELVEADNSCVVRLCREGQYVTLIIEANGRIRENVETGDERHHVNFRALLASSNWANLGKWADTQSTLLQRRIEGDTIPIEGRLAQSQKTGDLTLVDDALVPNRSSEHQPRTTVLLIDGPAGIGKTSLIRSLAYHRAVNFRRTQRPLILHVESRGRMLQNITDLIAFSLQTLRSSVTYDQVPVLVRHGLVTLAIDGFDELGDPNGYDLAWAQVNDLVIEARGQGQIILAGRETFIGRERMKKALTALDEATDQLDAYTLHSIKPHTARSWLADRGWSEELLDSEAVEPLFEPTSYALRPFFLSELARDGVAQQIQDGDVGDLLPFLIGTMTKREATKFGRDVENITTEESRSEFITRLMEEIARDIAENQTSAIPSETIFWLAEISAEKIVPDSLFGILKNRSGVLAFLKDDDRRGYKSFVHEQVYNYFLARVTIRAIVGGEIPKFIRRNILGIDFFEAFVDVFRLITCEQSDRFIQQALDNIETLGEQDRARQNLGSLVMSACCVYTPVDTPVFQDMSIDEVFLLETVSNIKLERVFINQITANGVDLRGIYFDKNCSIVSFVGNDGTIFNDTCPKPAVISLPEITTYDPAEISDWMIRRRHVSHLQPNHHLNEMFRSCALLNLLTRVVRYKPFWIKDNDERGARRILDDDNWPFLKDLMIKHELLIERTNIGASGRPAPFYHVKNRAALMNLDNEEGNMKTFILEVMEECK
ncbi:hypothetical protein [Acetobacter sp.]|uniref:hypothetical protein n=1 Tax=Acetobacter sp. TaxID=440 RepID=UPI0039EB5F33